MTAERSQPATVETGDPLPYVPAVPDWVLPAATVGATTCPHGVFNPRTCEDCRWVAAAEGRVATAPDRAPVGPVAVAAELADVNLLIERADLGPGAYTQVHAGQPIPAGLVGLPRRPATA